MMYVSGELSTVVNKTLLPSYLSKQRSPPVRQVQPLWNMIILYNYT